MGERKDQEKWMRGFEFLSERVRRLIYEAVLSVLRSKEFESRMGKIVSDVAEKVSKQADCTNAVQRESTSDLFEPKGEEQDRVLDELRSCIQVKDAELSKARSMLENAQSSLADRKNKLQDTRAELENARNSLKDRENELRESNTELENTRSTLKEREDELQATRAELENTRSRLEEQRSKLQETRAELESTQSSLTDRENKLRNTRGELGNARDSLKDRENELRESNTELENTRSTLKEREDELRATRAELGNTRSRLEEQGSKLQETRAELESTQKELIKADRALSSAKSALQDTEYNLAAVTDQLDKMIAELTESTDKYVGIYGLMCKCDSMKAFLEEYVGVSDDRELSVSEKIKFVNLIGNDFSLARNIYVALEKYKSTHEDFLSDDEIAFIDAVNTLYATRENNPCSYIVLDCLSLEHENQKDFKRKIMKDLIHSGSTEFVYAKGIYVPALKTEDGNDYERKAIVKGE